MIIVSESSGIKGTIKVSGSKNAALPIKAANYACGGKALLHNMPNISDIHVLNNIFDEAHESSQHYFDLTGDLVKNMRASILLIPYGLLHYNSVHFSKPGGCKLGKRSLTAFDDAFIQSGINIEVNDTHKTYSLARKPSKHIILQELSVTTTEAMLIYLSLSNHYDYSVTIHLCAIEPHVHDLIKFLRGIGAKIEEKPDHRLIVHPYVLSVKSTTMISYEHTIIGDYIEAALYMVAGAIVPNSEVTITGLPVDNLYAMLMVFNKIGVTYKIINPTTITIFSENMDAYHATTIQSMIYPGLATDVQSAFGILLTQCHGISKIHEPLFEGRFAYLAELESLGAHIEILNPHQALIIGPSKLQGGYVASKDLRGGSAMILAGLIAKGTTKILNEEIIFRGYENIIEKMRSLGVGIKYVTDT